MDILILTSGNVSRLDNFKNYPGVFLGSFKDINFVVDENKINFKDRDLKDFSAIYFRFVGKSFEIASVIGNYAKENNILIIDGVYETSNLMPSSLGKSIELLKLAKAGLPVPKTVFGDFSGMDFPYVIKSTTGQRAKEVWLVHDSNELNDLNLKLDKHKYYFAQELISDAHRIRVLTVGDRAVGAIVRQTKWNRDETHETLSPIPKEIADIAVKASKAVNLDISGVDILTNNTGKFWIIEANAAPSWKLINSNCGVNVEDEIIKYIRGKI